MNHERYMKRCYELAVQAGRKGFDTFGAVLVHDGKIIEEAENTADWEKGIARYRKNEKPAGDFDFFITADRGRTFGRFCDNTAVLCEVSAVEIDVLYQNTTLLRCICAFK